MVKDVYDIYRVLFTTENTVYMGCQNQHYLVVQNSIDYDVEETAIFDDSTTTISFTENEITNFRPSIIIEGKKILYLTNEYKEALLSFLNNNPGSESEILTQPYESNKMKRYYFINQYIPIELLEGRTWIVQSTPYTDGFYFENNHVDCLRVGYQIHYYGYDAIMKRTEDGWILENRKVSSVI